MSVLCDDAAIRPAIKSNAQTAFGIADEVFGFLAAHARQVVNVQFAVAAKALALVAVHPVPVGRTRAGDSDIFQRIIEIGHKNSVQIIFSKRCCLIERGVMEFLAGIILRFSRCF